MNRKGTCFRNGTFYTIKNYSNKLALAMPNSQKYTKDRPFLQPHNPENINQLWMIEEVQPSKFQIVHAISTLVLVSLQNSHSCKLEYGKQKNSQFFYFELVKDNWIDNQRKSTLKYEKVQIQETNRKLIMKEAEELPPRKTNLSKIAEPSTDKKIIRYRIRENQKSEKYLFCSNKDKNTPKIQQQLMYPEDNTVSIKFMEVDMQSHKQEVIWEIQKVDNQDNRYLQSTCTIASFRSHYALDVPGATQKHGTSIIQYPCNFRFNQKWILKRVDPKIMLISVAGHHLPKRVVTDLEAEKYSYFKIMNAKTRLILNIKGASTKVGTNIIQWPENGDLNQIWRFEEQGKHTYVIRSVLDNSLLMSVKDNSLKEEAEIVTGKLETESLWLILGYIPNEIY